MRYIILVATLLLCDAFPAVAAECARLRSDQNYSDLNKILDCIEGRIQGSAVRIGPDSVCMARDDRQSLVGACVTTINTLQNGHIAVQLSLENKTAKPLVVVGDDSVHNCGAVLFDDKGGKYDNVGRDCNLLAISRSADARTLRAGVLQQGTPISPHSSIGRTYTFLRSPADADPTTWTLDLSLFVLEDVSGTSDTKVQPLTFSFPSIRRLK